MKKIKSVVVLAILMLVLAAGNASAAWYRVVITNVIPRPAGEVDIKFTPGTGETRFTGKCVAQVIETDVGAKSMLATILTAVSINKEVTVNLVNVPSPTANQSVEGVGLALD